MLLSQVLHSEDICLNLKASRKIDAIREIVDRIAETGKIADKGSLFEAVVQREAVQSTALTCGVAVPHARIDAAMPHAKTDAVRGIIIGLGISQQGVDFDAPDHSPAHLVFLIAAPRGANTEYLKLLQNVCNLLQTNGFREQMLTAEDPRDVLQAIQACESQLQAPG